MLSCLLNEPVDKKLATVLNCEKEDELEVTFVILANEELKEVLGPWLLEGRLLDIEVVVREMLREELENI